MILLVAPYQRTDVTCAAIRLWQWFTSRGETVHYLATSRASGVLHLALDQQVRSVHTADLYALTRWAKLVVWFEPYPVLAEMLDLLDTQPRQVLVACPSLLQPWDESVWRGFLRIVAAPPVIVSLRQQWANRPLAEQRLLPCHWDAGVPLVRRDGLLQAHQQVRFLVLLDTPTVKGPAASLWSILSGLLPRLQRSSLTVACSARCSDAQQRQIQALSAMSSRFSFLRWRTWDELWLQAHQHDVVAYLAQRYDTTALASRLLATGSPLITWDHPVMADWLHPQRAGWLVRCAVDTLRHDWWSAVPDWHAFADCLVQIDRQPREVLARQAGMELSRSFVQTWSALLEEV